jgi:hypothetical protein
VRGLAPTTLSGRDIELSSRSTIQHTTYLCYIPSATNRQLVNTRVSEDKGFLWRYRRHSRVLTAVLARLLYRGARRNEPPHQDTNQTSTRDNSANISSIEAALAAIESLELGEQFSYRQIAKDYGCDRTTLARRH